MHEGYQLNLGCGKDIKPGFANIDIHDLDGVDIVADVRNLYMFDDASCFYILASDIIEHFTYAETGDLLREWSRVLQVDGVLEIRTPNMKWVAEHYLEHSDCEFISYHLFGCQENKENFHYIIFDREWLSSFCLQFGLEEIDFKEEGSNFRVRYEKK